LLFQDDVHGGGVRMTKDIGQRLLQNAEKVSGLPRT
jgi:hypothetical protein